MEVKYYPFPGRGESVRVLLAIGGFEFTVSLSIFAALVCGSRSSCSCSHSRALPAQDTGVEFEDWPGEKPDTRWGMMPTLKLPSGQVAGQSQPLLRYLGKQIEVEGSPLTPTDDLELLLVDEILSFVGEDIWRVLLAVRSDEDAALETISAGGQAHGYLDELETNIGGSDSVLPSGALSIADTYIFAAFGWWASGFMTEHVNTDSLLGGRPKLQAIVDRVYAPLLLPFRCLCLVRRSLVSECGVRAGLQGRAAGCARVLQPSSQEGAAAGPRVPGIRKIVILSSHKTYGIPLQLRFGSGGA